MTNKELLPKGGSRKVPVVRTPPPPFAANFEKFWEYFLKKCVELAKLSGKLSKISPASPFKISGFAPAPLHRPLSPLRLHWYFCKYIFLYKLLKRGQILRTLPPPPSLGSFYASPRLIFQEVIQIPNTGLAHHEN